MPSSLPSDAGLSLTEVMVSIFILSLATSAIVLSAPERPDPLDTSVARVTADIERLMDLSMVSGNIMGMDINSAGYQIVTLRSGIWVPVNRPVKLSDVTLTDDSKRRTEDDVEDAVMPEVQFDPTGIASPHSFTIAYKRRTETLHIQLNGTVEQERVS